MHISANVYRDVKSDLLAQILFCRKKKRDENVVLAGN